MSTVAAGLYAFFRFAHHAGNLSRGAILGWCVPTPPTCPTYSILAPFQRSRRKLPSVHRLD